MPRHREEKPPAGPHEASDRTAAVATVDVAVLKKLVGNDPAMVRRVLATYRASARRLADEWQAARAAHDIRRIGAIAHQLKSSSRAIGALAFGDLCAELENAC